MVKQDDLVIEGASRAATSYAELCIEAAQTGEPWSLTIDDIVNTRRLFDIRGGH